MRPRVENEAAKAAGSGGPSGRVHGRVLEALADLARVRAGARALAAALAPAPAARAVRLPLGLRRQRSVPMQARGSGGAPALHTGGQEAREHRVQRHQVPGHGGHCKIAPQCYRIAIFMLGFLCFFW